MPLEYAEPEAYNFDYDPERDWPEYEPEAPRPRPGGAGGPYRPPVPGPRPQPQPYVTPTPSAGTVTRAQLERALQRVAGDIDRLRSGVRANTGQVNDLADRTRRALRNVQSSQQQQVARLDRGVANARETGVLGAALTGGGQNLGILLLLLLGGDTTGTADGQAPGGTLGSGNTSLLLALALSGALNPQTP